MGHAQRNTVVTTEKNKCRVCFTCVRECPVKAIKIIDGQAEVVGEKCIGCGNCVTVCSQNAKVILDLKDEVECLLKDKSKKVVAMIAPSFPAEFTEYDDHKTLIGMIRKLGFDKILDVAFGADLVAKKYKSQLEQTKDKTYISSDCPAIVYYVEQYHPELVDRLAHIASPMVATSRIARDIYGADVKTVFIGPCIAKKAESDEVDEALTFTELRAMFKKHDITPDNSIPSDFNGPLSGMGALFPVSRGLLQNVKKSDNVVEGDIIVDSGKKNFKEAIREFENDEISDYHLELLCCDGCIMGPGMSDRNNFYLKWSQISKYTKSKLMNHNENQWQENLDRFYHLDLKQSFTPMDRRKETPDKDEIDRILQEMGKFEASDHLNCGACGYNTCYNHAVAIAQGYAEEKMCLPYTIEKLHDSVEELHNTNETLKSTKLELKHSEKLANMGQISAGIAHELNNPLGVITMYSNIALEELKNDNPMRSDVKLIVEQADRCKKIVSGLLNFARKNKIRLQEVNIVEFLNSSLDSIIIPENINASVTSDITNPYVMIDEDQMLQVFTNLEKNAVEAMPNGGDLKIKLGGNKTDVVIKVTDTGTGIPKKNMDKMFTPFFTTKDVGKGTGLGLPLVYGIIKMHNGKIEVRSNADPEEGKTGTEFIITLPRVI